ncbi:MAG TPA: glycosyltransferase family 39 protein [bacterium]|mgnify:CR=1 FL=1|nr:glycosyltransferase family 39 protein [bacterium]HOL47234.1 glycosyltransferase family 39 protein [bacterium]HPQ18257.1 glycosyltransferase family 39 protein [bacterium]
MKKKKLKSKDQNQIKKNQFNLFLFIDKNAKIIFWIIFIYGILIRLFYFYSVANSPEANILLEHTDSFTYHNIALKIIEGDWSGGQKIFYYNPGYAYFLAFIYSIFGVNYNYVRLIQILLNIFTIPCGYLISYKITGNRFISLFTALIISSYGPLIYHTNMILIVGILPSLILYLFYLFLNLYKSHSPFYYAGIGLLSSIIILLRPNFILIVAIFIFFIYYFHNKNKWLIYSLIYLFFLFLLILPFTIHNYKNTKEFILISANAGINFFIGNNIEADGVYSRPNILIKYSEELEKLKITSPTAQSNYWFKKTFEYIKKNPFHFLKLQIKKFLLFWWGKEIASNDDYREVYRHGIPFS